MKILSIYIILLLVIQLTIEKKHKREVNNTINDVELRLLAEWMTFTNLYGLVVNDDDENRKNNFFANVRRIWEHNERYAKGEETYEQGINEFTDKEEKELVATVCSIFDHDAPMLSGDVKDNFFTDYQPVVDNDIPKQFDWRDRGAVNPVRNQGVCSSCWAFSVTENLEAQYFLKTNKRIVLSPQQFVDCDDSNSGCNGGNTKNAFKYAMGGVQLDEDYSYEGERGECRFNKSKIVIVAVETVSIKEGDEEAMKIALYKEGPLDIGIYAAPSLHRYKSGVYTSNKCTKSVKPTHAISVVGYGITENGIPYWTMRNSWGKQFGEDGFFRIVRGNNTCAIATRPTFVRVTPV